MLEVSIMFIHHAEVEHHDNNGKPFAVLRLFAKEDDISPMVRFYCLSNSQAQRIADIFNEPKSEDTK